MTNPNDNTRGCPFCGAALVVEDLEPPQRLVCAACRGTFGLDGGSAAARVKTTSRKAIFSLVLGLASVCGLFLTGIPAVLLGFVALRDIRRGSHLSGRGLAISGIVTGAGFGFLVSLCAGFSVAIGVMTVNAIQNKNDPKQIAAVAASMDSYNPPPGTKPIEAVDLGLVGIRWVVHADSPPTHLLMVMQFAPHMASNPQQMEQQIRMQSSDAVNNHLGPWIDFSPAEALTIDVNGKPLRVEQQVGTDLVTDIKYRKYLARIEAPQGPMMMLLVTSDPASRPRPGAPAAVGPGGRTRGPGGMTEAQVKKFFQSLQVGEPAGDAGSENSKSKGGP